MGRYDFSGFNDVTTFISKAQEEDLMVILRPGPFIDAERDMVGVVALEVASMASMHKL